MTWARRTTFLFVCTAGLTAGKCGGEGTNHEPKAKLAAESCYKRSKLDIAAPKLQRSLFVLVDQTTAIDQRLRATILENLESLLEPGTSFRVSTFSANSRGNYPTLVASGTIEEPVSEDGRASLSVRGLARLDNCLKRQAADQIAKAKAAVAKATGASASSFTNSQIIGGLRQLATAVRKAPGERRLVVIASDLLEHSPEMSFYSKRGLRLIDPAAELAKAKEAKLIADFGGAQVAVVGAGLIPSEGDSGVARNERALDALEDFWRGWFEASRARVVEIGRPDLQAPLAWADPESPGEEGVEEPADDS